MAFEFFFKPRHSWIFLSCSPHDNLSTYLLFPLDRSQTSLLRRCSTYIYELEGQAVSFGTFSSTSLRPPGSTLDLAKQVPCPLYQEPWAAHLTEIKSELSLDFVESGVWVKTENSVSIGFGQSRAVREGPSVRSGPLSGLALVPLGTTKLLWRCAPRLEIQTVLWQSWLKFPKWEHKALVLMMEFQTAKLLLIYTFGV